MDPPPDDVAGRCDCACALCGRSSSSPPWCRSVKRKLDQADASIVPPPATMEVAAARVEVENEVAALRESLESQQQAIQELATELDEERSAAASAASETMSMILRLQREKAEAQMELRQFKRLAEEKMAHDQNEIVSLEELLFRRDQAIQSLFDKIQAYKRRLLSLGVDLGVDDRFDVAAGVSTSEYPSLRCSIPELGWNDDELIASEENYVLGESPRELENRIYELENSPGDEGVGVVEEVVDSPSGRNSVGEACFGSNAELEAKDEVEEVLAAKVYSTSSYGHDSDDSCDRVYTIDAIHARPVNDGCDEELLFTPTVDGIRYGDGEETQGSLKKLYKRLQALEADRESMRQALISMRTEKAQLVLLKEIAQQFCKEATMEKKAEKKQYSSHNFATLCKRVSSLATWRKKATRSRYTFGLSSSNAGLLLLLEKPLLMKHRKL